MKQIKFVFLISLFLASMLFGCEKQKKMIDLANIDLSDIEKIEHTGTTGGKESNYTYSFSDGESSSFIELLNQVELGAEVDANKALSSGAVSYYILYFADGQTVTISPGRCFKIEDTYYDFKNYDELWDEFIDINSKH